MADGVQAVLVLSTDVALQSLHDAVGLRDFGEGEREEFKTHSIQIKTATEIQHLRGEPALLLDRSVQTSYIRPFFPTSV